MSKGFSTRASLSLLGILALGAAVGACGKKASKSAYTPASKNVADGGAISLTGSLSTGGGAGSLTGLNLAATAESGTIKCTYADADEDKAAVTNGAFTMACKSGKSMVISFFNSDGEPTCSIKFKVKTKDVSTASIRQNVNFGNLVCTDGEAIADLDVLAPESANAQSLVKDASVSLVNADDNHWKFDVKAVAELGLDGKKKGSTKVESKKRSKSTASLALNERDGKDGGKGDKNDMKGFNLAFYDTNSDDAKLADGKIRVGHQDDESGEWEFIDNADIVWSGKSFTINLKEVKDIQGDFARNEIENQRGGSGIQRPSAQDFQQGCNDQGCGPQQGGPSQPGSMPVGMPGQASGNAEPAPQFESPQIPEQFAMQSRFPIEAYCSSANWKAKINLAPELPCDKLANFEFVDFGKVCTSLASGAGDHTMVNLQRNNVLQCNAGPVANTGFSDNRKNDQMCMKSDSFGGHNPADNFMGPVNAIQTQISELKSMIALADGDADLTPVKGDLQGVVDALQADVKVLLQGFAEMKTAAAQIETNRQTFCAGGEQVPKEENDKLFGKLNGQRLQPIFQKLQRLIEEKVYRNPRVNEARRKYMSAPNIGFDGKACLIPENGKKFIKFDFLKPGGECKVESNITLAGSFKDAKTIPNMTVTFMDKLAGNGECSLTLKRIAFDETSGCWEFAADGTPKLATESADKEKVFQGQGLQRMKLIGSATLENDE